MPNLNRKNSPPIYVDSYGKVTTFFLQTTMAKRSAVLVNVRVPAIRTALLQEQGESLFFTMWATSFEEMARALQDSSLIQRALESPDWSMVPLAADYDLVLGCMRSSITNMHIEDETLASPAGQQQ